MSATTRRRWKDRIYCDYYQHWIVECFCGWTNDGYFEPMWNALKAHIDVCEQHKRTPELTYEEKYGDEL